MGVADDGVLRPLETEYVEGGHNDDAHGESDESDGVLATNTPDLPRTDSAPKDGSGEESVDTRAGESEGSLFSADILDVDLVLENGDADKGRH